MGDAQRVRELLVEVRAQRPGAADELFQLLYDELREIAGRLFRSQPAGHTLQPTVLVHEAYARMVGGGKAPAWNDATHFRAVAARAMRQVLVNHARDKKAVKRGGDQERERLTLSGVVQAAEEVLGVLDLHEALEKLAALDERQAQIAEYRLFAGLTNQEVADALGVSLRTVELDWRMARSQLAVWLKTEG